MTELTARDILEQAHEFLAPRGRVARGAWFEGATKGTGTLKACSMGAMLIGMELVQRDIHSNTTADVRSVVQGLEDDDESEPQERIVAMMGRDPQLHRAIVHLWHAYKEEMLNTKDDYTKSMWEHRELPSDDNDVVDNIIDANDDPRTKPNQIRDVFLSAIKRVIQEDELVS